MAFRWYFGDGDTSIITSPSHSYKAVDTFHVKLTALSSLGCYNQIFANMYVKSHPVVNLGKDSTVYDTSHLKLDAGTGFDKYLWSTSQTTSSITLDTTGLGVGPKIFWVKVTKNGCDGSDSVIITILHYNSIQDKSFEFDVRIYPNPTKDVINISLNGLTKDVTFVLTDISGNVIQTMKVNANQNNILRTMDISNLAKGVYLLNIMDNSNKQAVRVVKY